VDECKPLERGTAFAALKAVGYGNGDAYEAVPDLV
jgi:hypothetical protein